MLAKTFDTDGKRKAFHRKLLSLDYLDRMISAKKVPTEHSRRPRKFSPHWKSSEYKAVVMFFFPALLDVVGAHHEDVDKLLLRDVWALLSYIVHLYSRDEDEMAGAALSPTAAMKEFTTAFVKYFGKYKQTFNLHMFTHIQRLYDVYGPIHNASAYASEDAYQEMLACMKAGTINVGKQAMENMNSCCL